MMKKVLALLLALALALSLAACGGKSQDKPDTTKKTYSSPEEHYRAVETQAVKAASKSLESNSGLTGLYSSMLSADSKGAVDGSITVTAGTQLTDLLGDLLGTDMSWLQSVGLLFTLDQTQDDLLGAKATVQLNGTSIVNADAVYQKDAHMAFFRVPEFSEKYVGVDMEDVLQDYVYENGYDQTYMLLYNLVYGDEGQLQNMLSAMPDAETVSSVIQRYVDIVTKDLTAVEAADQSVTAGGVTCNYTSLTVEIDRAQLEEIAKAVVAEAKDDAELKEIICSIASASGEDGEEVYQQLHDELVNADITIEEDVHIVMVVYVDGNDAVQGRDIQVTVDGEKAAAFRYISTEKDGKFGTDVLLDTPEATVSVTGGGTKNGDHIQGTLTVTATMDGLTKEIGTMDVDGDYKDNNFVGSITLTPSQELLDMVLADADLPSYLEDLVRDAKLVLTNSSTEDHLDVTITLKSGDADLLSVRIDCQKASPMTLTVPSDYVSPEAWASSLDQMSLLALIGNLQNAGMPASFLTSLVG